MNHVASHNYFFFLGFLTTLSRVEVHFPFFWGSPRNCLGRTRAFHDRGSSNFRLRWPPKDGVSDT